MSNIIGQSRLLSVIDNYTIQTLPKSLLFIGPLGCGKHLMAKYMAEKFNLDFLEVTNADDLEDFLYKTIDTLYLIDLNKFSEKQQNQFLKFIEEPTKTVYIVLIASSESGIINTILNRCVKYTFEQYTKEQLETITNAAINDIAFNMFKTPGKLLNLTDTSFTAIYELASHVVHNIGTLSYPAALAVSTKVNYKDLYNKVDFNLLFDAIEYLALEDFKGTGNKQSFVVFEITNKFKQAATQQILIKEVLMINYITNLWEATHT